MRFAWAHSATPTVGAMKQWIAAKTGYVTMDCPSSEWALLFNNRRLRDAPSLISYGIYDGCILTLEPVFAVRGGSSGEGDWETEMKWPRKPTPRSLGWGGSGDSVAVESVQYRSNGPVEYYARKPQTRLRGKGGRGFIEGVSESKESGIERASFTAVGREALAWRIQHGQFRPQIDVGSDVDLGDTEHDLADTGGLDSSSSGGVRVTSPPPEAVEREVESTTSSPSPSPTINVGDREQFLREMIREAESLDDDEDADSEWHEYVQSMGKMLAHDVLRKIGLVDPDVSEGQKIRDHPAWVWAKRWQPEALRQGVDFEKVWPVTLGSEARGSRTNIPPRSNGFYPFHNALDVALTSLLAMGVLTKMQYELVQKLAVAHLDVAERTLPSYRVLRSNMTRLPILPLYLKSYTEVTESEEEGGEPIVKLHWCAYHSLFDLLARTLQFGNDFAECTFLPTMGDYISELHHGRVWASGPLFTFPWLLVTGKRYWLGSYVRYQVPGEEREAVGQIVTLHEPDDGATFARGLSEMRGTSVDDVLKKACNRYPTLIASIRRCRPTESQGANVAKGAELIAEWDVEDRLLGGEGILCEVRVVYTVEKYERALREEGARGKEDGLKVYLCQYADVSKVIGASPSAGLVSMLYMPTHPMGQHRYNFERLQSLPVGVPVLRIFWCLYADVFGAYQRLYRPTYAVYGSLGNKPHYLQQQLQNILQVVLAPPNMPLDVACETMYKQIRELQNGVMLYLGTILGWVFLMGTVGIFRTDTVDGQKLTGHLACTADRGCRLCKVWKSSYSDMTWDVVANQRTINEERVVRDLAAAERLKGKAHTILTGMGLAGTRDVFTENGILASYLRAFPYDIFHAELLGVVKLALGRFVGALLKAAQKELAARLEAFPKPPSWNETRFPVLSPNEASDGLTNYQGKEMAKLVQIFPFLVIGWVTEEHFTPNKRARFQLRLGKDWLKALTNTSVLLSNSCKEAFIDSRPSGRDRAMELHVAVKSARQALVRAWPHTFGGRSNTHNGLHMVMAHLDFACRCVDARRLETAHGRNRVVTMRNSNHHEPEVDMQKANAVRQSLEFWMAGGHEHYPDETGGCFTPGPLLIKMLKEDPFMRSLISASATGEIKTYAEGTVHNERDWHSDQKTHVLSTRSTVGVLDCGSDSVGDLHRAYKSRGLTSPLRDASPPVQIEVRQYTWVDVRGRPRWRRRVQVGESWEINIPLRQLEGQSESMAQRERCPPIALVEQVFTHGESPEVWILVTWYVLCRGADTHPVTGAPLYEKVMSQNSPQRLLSPALFLRPVHVLPVCRSRECEGRPHFDIGCSVSKSGVLCMNTFFVK